MWFKSEFVALFVLGLAPPVLASPGRMVPRNPVLGSSETVLTRQAVARAIRDSETAYVLDEVARETYPTKPQVRRVLVPLLEQRLILSRPIGLDLEKAVKEQVKKERDELETLQRELKRVELAGGSVSSQRIQEFKASLKSLLEKESFTTSARRQTAPELPMFMALAGFKENPPTLDLKKATEFLSDWVWFLEDLLRALESAKVAPMDSNSPAASWQNPGVSPAKP